MQFPILVEPTPDGRYLAQIGQPFQISTVADDPQHASIVKEMSALLKSGWQAARPPAP